VKCGARRCGAPLRARFRCRRARIRSFAIGVIAALAMLPACSGGGGSGYNIIEEVDLRAAVKRIEAGISLELGHVLDTAGEWEEQKV